MTENKEKFIIKVLSKSEFDNLRKMQSFYAMDFDKIDVQANFRTRKAGDKFCQVGRGVTKSVKKLLQPQNINTIKKV